MTITQPVARPVVGAVARAASGPQGVSPTRGPELLTSPLSTSGATVVISGLQATFTSANQNDIAYLDIALEDGATYEFKWRVITYTGGSARSRGFGATTAHSASGTARTTTGTFTESLVLTGAGASTNRIQVQANNATAGSNSFVVVFDSLKKVLR
jgi:hypothetical protein